MISNLLISIIDSVIFIVIIISNFKFFKVVFQLLSDNFEEERFILDGLEYSTHGNRKYLIRFMCPYILGIFMPIIIVGLVIGMWLTFSSGGIIFELCSISYSFAYPFLISLNMANAVFNCKEKFKNEAVSIEQLKAIGSCKKCQQFIKDKKYRLDERDAKELNSYYKKVHDINGDCFKTDIEEMVLKEREKLIK